MFELAATMKNPVNLSLGQADFDAPSEVKDAAIEAIRAGKNRYTITSGVTELQQAVESSLKREGIHSESVLAVAGASGGLILALFALADEDVEVLVPDPYFVSYPSMVQLTGAKTRLIDTYPDFRLTPERLRAATTPKSKILIFNSPSNPTGVAYNADEIKALALTVKELGLQVISDEVYDLFCYDFPYESWVKYDPSAILIRSFSKTGGIPGWRAGYAAGPREIIENMKVLQQFSFVCVNSPAQWGAIASLTTDMSAHTAAYREKRDMLCEGLSKTYRFNKPEGAFYLFPEVPKGDSKKFIAECIAHELLIVPGETFSEKATHFRISYAVDNETLRRGIKLLNEVAERC